MSYTGTEIFEMAVVVIDELSDTGTVNDSQVKEYKYKAPRLLDMWQREIARIESITDVTKITALTQELQVSERNCISGAYYLAMHFAISDQNNELAALCKGKYQELKAEAAIPAVAVDIIDVYSLTGGGTIEQTE